MGPILFIVYTNDRCDVAQLLNIIFFAHDTSIFYSTRNIVNTACIEKLDTWFRVNKLSFNVNKTNFITFANKNQHRPAVNITLNGMKSRYHIQKFLGVVIDKNIMWKEQIKTVETKVSKSIDVLYKTNYVYSVQALRYNYHLLNHIPWRVFLIAV